jgi:hypothetical protein
MEGRGKVVRNAGISGRHEITNSMRRTPSIGQGIEGRGWQGGLNLGH